MLQLLRDPTCKVLTGQLLLCHRSELLLERLRGGTTAGAGESAGVNPYLTGRRDDNFDGLQAAPPFSWMATLIEPSAMACSVTEFPCRRASSFAFSTA